MKTSFIKKSAAIILSAVTIATTFAGCSGGVLKKAKVEENISITYTGLNHRASYSYDIDMDAINAQFDKKKVNKYVQKLAKKAMKENMDLEDLIEYGIAYASKKLNKKEMKRYISNLIEEEIGNDYFDFFYNIKPEENYENLSNGDQIKFVIEPAYATKNYELKEINQNLGLNFKSEYTFKVEGLEEGKQLDLFKGIADCVKFSGANGYGAVGISIPDDFSQKVDDFYITYKSSSAVNIVRNNEYIGYFNFVFDLGENVENGKLNKGDKVKLILSDSNGTFTQLQREKYIPKDDGIVLTCPDLGTYIMSTSEITDEEFAKIKADLLRKVEDKFNDATIVGYYYADVKSDKVVKPEMKTYVAIIFEYYSWFSTNTYGIDAYNVKRMPDGTLSYSIGDHYGLYNGYESLNDSYNYTKVA